MNKRFGVFLAGVLSLSAAASVCGQAMAGGSSQAAAPSRTNASQGRAIGEVVSVDSVARQLSVRTDDGRFMTIAADEKTSITRVPAGAPAADKAVKIPFAEISVGERLFARGDFGADQLTLAARQIVVTSSSRAAVPTEQSAGASGGAQPQQQGRTIVGRITALNPQKREIQLATRTREGAETVTVAADGAARIRRFAPDSLEPKDAVQAAFDELRVGDQLRASGERSADGARFAAEELVAGSVVRVGGTVTALDAAKGELTIKTEQTGQTHIVRIGTRSMLRRVPAEVSDSLNERREQREQRREQRQQGAAAAGSESSAAQNARREARRNGNQGDGVNRQAGGERRRGAGGRNLMQMLENLPAITLAELKKGDTVLITGTTAGRDESHLTAVALLTGDPAFLSRLRQFQGRGGRGSGGNVSPGLPGDVLGGGLPGPREPPRD